MKAQIRIDKIDGDEVTALAIHDDGEMEEIVFLKDILPDDIELGAVYEWRICHEFRRIILGSRLSP